MRYFIIIILFFSFINTAKAPYSEELHTARMEKVEVLLANRAVQEEIKSIESSEFSSTLLVKYLNLLNVDNSDILIRQVILETGWFKHIRCTKYNNYFGMREAKVRNHTQSGVWRGHATYEHWTMSIKDYILWQQYYKNKGHDTTNYYQFLDNIGYETASNYINTLKRINLNRLC